MTFKPWIVVFVFSLVSASPVWAQTKRIYLANDDHTDYMWTANEAVYRTAFRDMIDYYLNQINATATNPLPYQSRFNLDGSFWVWVYAQDNPNRFQELINRLKDGHVTMPLNTLAVVFGGQPTEAVLRGMYYAGQLERRYQLDFPLALAMENQTLPYGLGSLWAGAGAEYSWRGICNCATALTGAGNRGNEIYWWTGLDDSKILMKWNSLFTDNQGIGGYAEARNPSAIVEFISNDVAFQARYPYNVIGAFGKGWDDLSTQTDEFITTAQTKTTPSRQVTVSNEIDFFTDFAGQYGSSLPSVKTSFGNEWDLFSATISEYSARIRRSVEKLRSAESLAVLVSLAQPSFLDTYQANRNQAYVDLGLFWEHCGGSGGAVGQTARTNWMKGLVQYVENYVSSLQSGALSALGAQIKKQGTNARFFVFNPLSWVRTDYADYPYSGSTPVHVVEVATNEEVPSQLISQNDTTFLRILASNLPAVGYKAYEILPGVGANFPAVVIAAGSQLENQRYRLTIANRGAITSLIDKTLNNREFVRTINNRTINDLGYTTSGNISIENSGPVSATIVASSTLPIPHTTRVTLYRSLGRIEIDNTISQNFSSLQTWNYSLNVSNPDTYHEELGAVIHAKLEPIGHYSSRKNNTRYDWLTLNHFVDMTGSEGYGITLSNQDVDFMKIGNSTTDTFDTATPQIAAVAGGSLNSGEDYWGQGGSATFHQRFALQTHTAYNQTQAMKMSLEHQNLFVTGPITGTQPFYPETSYSLLSISDPDVLGWAIKPHEDGIAQGMVLRVWNQANQPKSFSVTLPDRLITAAHSTTHIETDSVNGQQTIVDGVMQGNITQQQLKTFRLSSIAKINPPPNTPPPPSLSPTPKTIPGDLDGSGFIDYQDIQYVLAHFSQFTVFTFNTLVENMSR